MTYYHVSQSPLDSGAILSPGRFGDAFREFRMPVATLTFESTCEQIRSINFPDKPSRLSCVYACADLAGAVAFRDAYRKGGGRIFEVEALDAATAYHVGTHTIPFGTDLHTMIDMSWRYWHHKWTIDTELLIGGEVRVLQEILEPRP